MQRPVFLVLLLAAGMVLLSACTTMPVTDAEFSARTVLYEERLSLLEDVESWSLEGRLAVSDENDGGSGHFSWQKIAQDSRMDFHGALGRGAWKLETGPGGAELELADGSSHHAESIDLLVRQQLGWQIPVETLAWWVRGLAAPESFEQRQLDENGNLSELSQRGWTIEYGNYRVVGTVPMPVKMTARKAEKSVKLAIRNWKLTGEQAGDG